MKKLFLALTASLCFAASAHASFNAVGPDPFNGSTFALQSVNTATGEPKSYIFCTANSSPTCDVDPAMTFNGSTLSTILGGYSTTGSLASAVARIGTLEGSSFSGSYLDLTNRPSLFSGAYSDLTGKPSLFSGAYSDLTGKPTLFSGSYTDLTNKPTIPSTLDQLSDGSTNVAFTTTLRTKLAGVATGATNVTNTTQLTNGAGFITAAGAPVQSVNGQTGAVSISIPSNVPVVYNGTTAMTNPVIVLKSGSTNSSGLAAFNVTTDNTSTGTALCPTAVAAVNVDVNSSIAAYGTSWSASGKVLTVTVTQPTSLLSLGLLPNAAVASGVAVNARIFCN